MCLRMYVWMYTYAHVCIDVYIHKEVTAPANECEDEYVCVHSHTHTSTDMRSYIALKYKSRCVYTPTQKITLTRSKTFIKMRTCMHTRPQSHLRNQALGGSDPLVPGTHNDVTLGHYADAL